MLELEEAGGEASMALDSRENHELPNGKEDDSSFLSALHFCCLQVVSGALSAALDHNLLEIIARANGRQVSATEIASQLPSSTQHEDLSFRIDRILRLLATHSVLTCSYHPNQDGHTDRLYGISSVGKFFVRGHQMQDGGLWAYFSMVNHPALVATWLNFKDAITEKDNDLFKKVHGMSMYQYAEKDPKWNKIFNTTMATVSNMEMRGILEIYKGFEGISTLVDVGGGTGQNLNIVVSKYPLIKGINFDLPHVLQNAPPYPGIEHAAGDMFASVPRGDAIILKEICHNWSDENSIKVLSKCYEALPQKGKVIVVEYIMPEVVEPSQEAQVVSCFDNIMFLQNGRERTEKEFESLCKRSGFSGFKVACRAFSVMGIMEFYK